MLKQSTISSKYSYTCYPKILMLVKRKEKKGICYASITLLFTDPQGSRDPELKTLAEDCMFEPDKPSHTSRQSYMLNWPPTVDCWQCDVFRFLLFSKMSQSYVFVWFFRCYFLRFNGAFSSMLWKKTMNYSIP